MDALAILYTVENLYFLVLKMIICGLNLQKVWMSNVQMMLVGTSIFLLDSSYGSATLGIYHFYSYS